MFKISCLKFVICPAIIISFSSCWTTSKFVERGKYNTANVPAGYNPSKHILLFIEMPRLNAPSQTNKGVTKKLDEALRDHFPYKYEIAAKDDVLNINSKYGDTSIYRFAVINNLNSITHTTTTTFIKEKATGDEISTVSPSARTTYLSFYFYDRITKEGFNNTGNSFPKLEYVVAAFSELIKRAKK
jgi:hypothetical protein